MRTAFLYSFREVLSLKKIISFLIVLSIIFTILPVSLFADTIPVYGNQVSSSEAIFDSASVAAIMQYFDNQAIGEGLNNQLYLLINDVAEFFNFTPSTKFDEVFFSVVDYVYKSVGYGVVSQSKLVTAVMWLNTDFRNNNLYRALFTLFNSYSSSPISSLHFYLGTSTLNVGGTSQLCYRINFNIDFDSANGRRLWAVDSLGGFPYSIVPVTTESVDSSVNYSWRPLNSNDLRLDSDDGLVSTRDAGSLIEEYNYYNRVKSSFVSYNSLKYIGVTFNGVEYVLCKPVNGIYHAVHYIPSSSNTSVGAVSYNGGYVWQALNFNSQIPSFSVVPLAQLQNISLNTPDSAIVDIDITAPDGTVYPYSVISSRSTDTQSINYVKKTRSYDDGMNYLYKVGSKVDEVLNFAYQQQGKPYVWGSWGPDSFDCSGFVAYVFSSCGVYLPGGWGTSQHDYNMTERISESELLPGDLVFYYKTYVDPNQEWTHVGIYIGGGYMINAGDPVQIQKITDRPQARSYGRVPGLDVKSATLLVSLRNVSDASANTSYNYYYSDPSVSSDVNIYDGGTNVQSQFINNDNSTVINISGDSGFGSVGSNAILLNLDDLIYDPSSKSYSTFANSSYVFDGDGNNYVSVEYNYSWNFFIDYTSITYIGTTADANETYHFYYQLPDGRSSSDLSLEDLKYLDVHLDCVTYSRATDNVSLRSLYHFNGDTLDSSYWNYKTSFVWDNNASITYIDAGENFGGALYLDELAHSFTCVLPSSVGSSDFTLEFRYYTSNTLNPYADSWVSIGNQHIMGLTGKKILNANGTIVGDLPVGSWVALCVMRYDDVLYYYANGVLLGNYPLSTLLTSALQFSFGDQQQTYKYFDELRFLSVPYYIEENSVLSNYRPSSVQFDTNLSMILPSTEIPVADAWVSVSNPNQTNLLSAYGLDWWDGRNDSGYFSNMFKVWDRVSSQNVSSSLLYPSRFYDGSNYVDRTLPHYYQGYNYQRIPSTGSIYTFDSDAVFTDVTRLSSYDYSSDGLIWSLTPGDSSRWVYPGMTFIVAYAQTFIATGDITFSMVASDGSIGSLSFNVTRYTSDVINLIVNDSFNSFSYPTSNGNAFDCVVLDSVQFNGYDIMLICTKNDSYPFLFVSLVPSDNPGDFVYLECVASNHTDLSAQLNGNVVPLGSLDTPTLAVRTDVTINQYLIGGVRPSVPSLGTVWAMVEDGIIRQIQVYNGFGWIEVDGRIWNGTRWIPYSSYNVITQNDLFDILGSDSSFSPVYSSEGFFNWFKQSWSEFIGFIKEIVHYFKQIVSNDGTNGTGVSDDTSNDLTPPPNSPGESEEDVKGLLGLLKSVFHGIVKFTTRSYETIGKDGIDTGIRDVGNMIQYFNPSSTQSIFYYPEDGIRPAPDYNPIPVNGYQRLDYCSVVFSGLVIPSDVTAFGSSFCYDSTTRNSSYIFRSAFVDIDTTCYLYYQTTLGRFRYGWFGSSNNMSTSYAFLLPHSFDFVASDDSLSLYFDGNIINSSSVSYSFDSISLFYDYTRVSRSYAFLGDIYSVYYVLDGVTYTFSPAIRVSDSVVVMYDFVHDVVLPFVNDPASPGNIIAS